MFCLRFENLRVVGILVNLHRKSTKKILVIKTLLLFNLGIVRLGLSTDLEKKNGHLCDFKSFVMDFDCVKKQCKRLSEDIDK